MLKEFLSVISNLWSPHTPLYLGRLVWIKSIDLLTLPDTYSDPNRVWISIPSRMHSSRMRTVRCSGRRAVGCVCPGEGCVCPGGCLPHPHPVNAGIHTPPSPCGQNDRRLWKHYLSATTLRTVKMGTITIMDPDLDQNLNPCLAVGTVYA